MNSKQIYSLIIRYLIALILGIFNLKLFYLIFTPLTVHPVFYILSIVDSATQLLPNNIISFKGFYAQIIPACVAGAAYYLLLILNLSTHIKIKTRIKSLLFLFSSFLVLNILRIAFFATLLVYGFQYFNFTHLFFWYFGSTILVVLIWFANVKIFKIKSIPVYTDMNNIFKDVRRKKTG